jgi:heme oxygenase (biliverdin-producing, ferredoxin)
MNVVMGATARAPLSDEIREFTSALHLQAERSGVVADILRKKADRKSYAMLLRNLLPAYRAMETALDRHPGCAVLRAFAQPALYRSARLEADLVAIHGHSWKRDLVLLPAGERYADRISSVADDGARLTGHAYVRYFGDLSGGQILKNLLGRTLKLPTGALTFYEFPEIPDVGAFKDGMRDRMNAEVVRLEDRDAILDEAVRAFQHNIDVSEAIQSG